MSDGPEGELTAARGAVIPLRRGEDVGVSDGPEGRGEGEGER
jgi:hypothetical protein